MDPNRLQFSLASFLVLAATACLESFQLLGTMFALGESGEPVSFPNKALLGITAIGILGLVIAAFGAFTGRRAFAVFGFASCLLVLPMAALFSWGALHADIVNSHLQLDPTASNPVIHISLVQWIVDGAAVPLVLVATLFSWLRIRGSPSGAMNSKGASLQE